MCNSEADNFKKLKKQHQDLYKKWKEEGNPCIICGKAVPDEKDHLPPKTLYPKELRIDQTYFFTFPVCSCCNRGSSDEDFLFSVLLSLGLNQEVYLQNKEPTDPDLLALHNQTIGQIEDSKLAKHRQKLLIPYIGVDPNSGRETINLDKLPINQTINKIVKSIYWLQTGGDILQNYNPGWWVLAHVDASKTKFINKHLKVSNADIYWDNKFITHYSVGLPGSGADGFISCSLHFYSKKPVSQGMTWFIIAAPSETKIGSQSIYDLCLSNFDLSPTIRPNKIYKKPNKTLNMDCGNSPATS